VNAQDLGQAEGDEVADEEKVAERIALVRTQTEASGIKQDANKSTKDGTNFNLISCIFIVLREQGHLWKCFILLGIATLAGGREFTLTERSIPLTCFRCFIPCASCIIFSGDQSVPAVARGRS
jgi:hypothetical protein